MNNFIKYGIPVLALILIIFVGYELFKPGVSSSPPAAVGDSLTCNIQYAPKIKQYNDPPKMCINTNKTYTADIETNMGDITIKLLPQNAPQTVNNFVFLAKSGFYDNLTFHRVIPGFVIQGGIRKAMGQEVRDIPLVMR